jgi:two-component system, chemotaxis family, sensor kinase CheA
MINDDLMRELLTTFYAEAAEHLEVLNQTLLVLERTGVSTPEQTERAQQALRAAHSLKGAARAVGMTEIERIAHRAENVLQVLQKGGTLPPRAFDTMYDTLDAIQQLLKGESVNELDGLLQRLDTIESEYGSGGAVVPPPPPADTTHAHDDDDRGSDSGESRANPFTADETIRVPVSRLDDLMAQVGELLIAKLNAEQHVNDLQELQRTVTRTVRDWRENRTLSSRNGMSAKQEDPRHTEHLQTLSQEVNHLNQTVNRDTLRLGMIANQLQDMVRRIRMIPFSTIAGGLRRAVRDAARSLDKSVEFTIEGEGVELDKRVLEALKDPLIHLLRNAVDHGIESGEIRSTRGKPVTGSIRLDLQQRGSDVHIVVSDDGRGFDLDAIRRASPHPIPADAPAMDVISAAFMPGVTTSAQVTSLSGRGVGLDVVRRVLESIQGNISVETTPRVGTTIRMVVPVSVAMTHGLLVQVMQGDTPETYVLPLAFIEKIIKVPAAEVVTVENQSMLLQNNDPVLLVPLAALLERPNVEPARGDEVLVVIVRTGDQRVALQVDDVLTELELTVKPLGMPLRRVRNVSGAALLGDGRAVIILNTQDLVKSARRTKTRIEVEQHSEDEASKAPASILIVDDSITTRTLEKSILETAGYDVYTATNGVDGLKKLGERSVNLVLSDIQMPEMDGIAFTKALREKYRNLPVILVSSLESKEDKERGMLAGANAYIVKRGFDQAELLATIEGLL